MNWVNTARQSLCYHTPSYVKHYLLDFSVSICWGGLPCQANSSWAFQLSWWTEVKFLFEPVDDAWRRIQVVFLAYIIPKALSLFYLFLYYMWYSKLHRFFYLEGIFCYPVRDFMIRRHGTLINMFAFSTQMSKYLVQARQTFKHRVLSLNLYFSVYMFFDKDKIRAQR